MINIALLTIFSHFSVLIQVSQLWESQDASLIEMRRVERGEGFSLQGDDINGDSVGDFFVSADTPGLSNGIKAISGATGGVLWFEDFSYLATSFSFDTEIAHTVYQMQDLNNDGCSDLILEVRVVDLVTDTYENFMVAISAQNGLVLWSHPFPSGHSGTIQIIFEDVTNDGFEDVLINMYEGFRCIDALSGYPLWDITLSNWWEYFSNSKVISDINGDGLRDIMIIKQDTGQTPVASELVAVSSSDGSYLWARALPYGEYPATEFIDANNDSFKDIILRNSDSSNGLNSNGGLTVYSGIDGNQLWSIVGTQDNEHWYGSTGFGDLNQDGIEDIVVDKGDAIKAYSGSNGSELWSFSIPGGVGNMPSYYGEVRPFDVNNDGVKDLIVSAFNASSNGLSENGSVFAISGVTGTTLWSVSGVRNNGHLGARCVVKDVNSDGYPDMSLSELDNHIVGTSADAYLRVISGFDGAEVLPQYFLGQVFDWVTGEVLEVSPLGDLTGDGLAEFAAQLTNWYSPPPPSTTKAYTYTTTLLASSDQISSSAGGNINYQINFGPTCNFYEYRMLMSFTQGVTPIGSCSVNLGFDLWLVKTYLGQWPNVFHNTSGLLDSAGMALVQLSTNQAPASLIGRTIYFAAIARMPWDEWSRSTNTVGLEIVQ